MSERTFLLPDLGEGLTEASLVAWLVAVGDVIRVDQPVAEVETAKSVVEVPSPFAGTVSRLHGEAGQTLDVGGPLLSVSQAVGVQTAAAPAAPAADAAARGAGHPDGEAYRQEKAGSGNVLIGYGTPAGTAAARRTRRPRTAPSPEHAPSPIQATPAQAPRCISPLVRRMARDAGLRLVDLQGSGADGLILRSDVQAAAAPAADATDTTDARTGLGIASRTPVQGLRRTAAANLMASRRKIPEATVWVDVDATALVELRGDLKRRHPDSTPGLLAFVARFVLAGLARFPELNTRFEPAAGPPEAARPEDGARVTAYDGVNLGFAAQTPRGLVVPSIRRADRLSARALDAEIRRLTAAAREGKTTPAELTSGTFTLNNYGVFGVDGSAAIINYPESAMLGIGRIIDKPWVVDGALAVRKMTELTLVFDHRVCDGGTAGGFLRYVADAMESPGSLLADL